MGIGESRSYYTSGSISRRFQQSPVYKYSAAYKRSSDYKNSAAYRKSYAYKVKQEALETQRSQFRTGASSIISQSNAVAQQTSVLALEQLQTRVADATEAAKSRTVTTGLVLDLSA